MVGLDNDLDMLTVAASRPNWHTDRHTDWHTDWHTDGRLLLLVGDMRRFALARAFGTIIVPYNSLQLLTSDRDVVACLRAAAAHLTGNGLVGVEVTDFQMGASINDVPNQLIHSDGTLSLWGSLHHDFAVRTTRYHRRFCAETGAVEDDVTLRSMGRSELIPLFAAAGLTPRRWWIDAPHTRVVAGPRAS